jgi:hypothetical protein
MENGLLLLLQGIIFLQRNFIQKKAQNMD